MEALVGNERRLFIAATSQNDGKTSCSIGLLKGLGRKASSVGFMKPVGQRYVTVGEAQVDEDAVLIQRILGIEGSLKAMNPVAVPQYFTREYLDNPEAIHPGLIRDIEEAYSDVSAGRDLVVIEGTGHAGVGSVFDLSNAHVARLLGAKVVLVTLGGIGNPVDEIALNRCLFEREGVEVIGVIANKVLPKKLEQTRHYLGKALERAGSRLFGAIPYASRLTWPTMQQVADATDALVINGHDCLDNPIAEVIIGAMTPHNALNFIRDKTLLIVPGDRDDLVLAAASIDVLREDLRLAGILFTGGILPQPQTIDLLSRTKIPALAVEGDTYHAATRVQKLTVKIQVRDEEKIRLAEDMVAQYVDLDAIWEALG
jgi:BioD-like phosphotransacetylase family protein